jgi:hypothetical protein
VVAFVGRRTVGDMTAKQMLIAASFAFFVSFAFFMWFVYAAMLDRNGLKVTVPLTPEQAAAARRDAEFAEQKRVRLLEEARIASEAAAEQKRIEFQISLCKSDWTKCIDNEQLVNNYSGWANVKGTCKREANEGALYGNPVWPSRFFTTFYTGKDYVTTGIVIAVEPNAQFQNVFGAMAHARIKCTYDLIAHRVISVTATPRGP